MDKKQLLILFSAFIFLSSNCNKEKNEECNKNITIVNNSHKAIYVSCDTHYPDTMYFRHFKNPATMDYNKVPANSTSNKPLQNRDCWEVVFNYGVQIPSDTLMVFVFDAEVLETEKWEVIVANYKVLKRYDLSLEDLKKLNWTITYP